MNLKYLSDEALLTETKACVAREREMTLSVLHTLREVERRKLYLGMRYSSLFDFATKELKYSSAAAMRRIDAMRLLRELPEIEEKIQEGTLDLTHVAAAQSFFKKEPVALEKKREIVAALENKSTRQAEKTLLQFSNAPSTHLREKIKSVTPELSEVLFYANDELLDQLERLKGLLAHSHPGMSTGDLITYLARMGLERLDPALQKSREKKTKLEKASSERRPDKTDGTQDTAEGAHPLGSAPNESVRQKAAPSAEEQTGLEVRKFKPRSASRRPLAALAREVWKRDGGRCVWTDPRSGQVCGSRYRIQIDHVFPWALGGEHSLVNLRCLFFA